MEKLRLSFGLPKIRKNVQIGAHPVLLTVHRYTPYDTSRARCDKTNHISETTFTLVFELTQKFNTTIHKITKYVTNNNLPLGSDHTVA